MEESDWGSLPGHLLDCILMKSATRVDLIHCAAVCRNWLREAKKKQVRGLLTNLPQIPLLLVPAGESNDSEDRTRTLYNVCTGRICPSITWEVPLPTRCCGSSFGCLIFMRRKLEIVIWNPVRGSPPICLPTLEEFVMEWSRNYEWQIHKVILSADPYNEPENCVVAALTICSCHLFFIRIGSPSWIPLPEDVYDPTSLVDVIYHHGNFYSISLLGTMFRIVVHDDSLTVLNRMRRHYDFISTSMYLIIASNGDFLMVYKLVEQYRTLHFSVFRLKTSQSSMEEYTWVSTHDLGGDAIFLGTNHGISVRATDFVGCRPNSIYYTDDVIENTTNTEFGPVDLGIFEMGTNSFSTHYQWKPCHKYMPPAIWIAPTPQFPMNVPDQV